MEIEKAKAIIEAILFACGREVKINELMSALELGSEDVIGIIDNLKADYESKARGIEIIKVKDGVQLTTKKEYYEYIYPIFDKRSKPNLSTAALETLSIIAYNPKITRAEIEAIRGVGSDGTIYKLLEYNLIESLGKSDAPGRPTMYGVTTEFFRMFGFSSLDELPELPKYKLDENQQIVIDDIIEEKNSEIEKDAQKNEEENTDENNNEQESADKLTQVNEKEEIDTQENNGQAEAPMPAREENENKETSI